MQTVFAEWRLVDRGTFNLQNTAVVELADIRYRGLDLYILRMKPLRRRKADVKIEKGCKTRDKENGKRRKGERPPLLAEQRDEQISDECQCD